LLWSKVIIGTAIYPPSVADLDGNGNIGIVQVTGGSPNNGRAYLFDANGNVHPGWPLNYSAHWIICGPVIADVSGDGVCEIIFQTRTSNNLHVVKLDGTPLNANWPINLGGTPAITPSVGDIDNDGIKEIVTATSNGVLFCFDADGQLKPGYPVASDNYSFSYQSPLLVDLDGTGQYSIVGTTHGTAPKFYVRNNGGTYRNGWPVPVPDNSWTYSPPTVVDLVGDGNYKIFMSRPVGETPLPMLFGFHPDGTLLNHFPIVKAGGLESFMSIADITGDGNHDIIFGSNMMVDSKGFIHAYHLDGGGEISGFPLRPNGFTFMNGPNLGDVTGDGILNLVALSYEQTFSATDSTVINVYDLQIPVTQANVLFGTYKGSNDRRGYVKRTVNPVIAISPLAFNIISYYPVNFTRDFNISNTGNAVLNYNIDIEYLNSHVSWLSFANYSGTVNAGATNTLGLLFKLDQLTYPQTYFANIKVSSNDPTQPLIIVPVTILFVINQIDEPATPSVLIYPNPAHQQLTIQSTFLINHVSLTNMDGGVLTIKKTFGVNNAIIDTSGFPAGVYLLVVTDEGGNQYRSKVVLTK
ncbi:MAG: T9SS type A sorting domain-containing protein, partial [Bacteroidales bacterium]|nr:T9SS type A sorting domain-containing protein [Bacteroidales bacterium]